MPSWRIQIAFFTAQVAPQVFHRTHLFVPRQLLDFKLAHVNLTDFIFTPQPNSGWVYLSHYHHRGNNLGRFLIGCKRHQNNFQISNEGLGGFAAARLGLCPLFSLTCLSRIRQFDHRFVSIIALARL